MNTLSATSDWLIFARWGSSQSEASAAKPFFHSQGLTPPDDATLRAAVEYFHLSRTHFGTPEFLSQPMPPESEKPTGTPFISGEHQIWLLPPPE